MCRPALTAGFLAYSFHSLLTACLIFGLTAFTITHLPGFLELTAFTQYSLFAPHWAPLWRNLSRSLRPPTAPTAWRTGSPDRNRSPRSPVLTEPRRPHLNGWIWIPHGFMIMLLLCVSQKLSTFIDISVSLHRRFQINRTFQI